MLKKENRVYGNMNTLLILLILIQSIYFQVQGHKTPTSQKLIKHNDSYRKNGQNKKVNNVIIH